MLKKIFISLLGGAPTLLGSSILFILLSEIFKNMSRGRGLIESYGRLGEGGVLYTAALFALTLITARITFIKLFQPEKNISNQLMMGVAVSWVLLAFITLNSIANGIGSV